MAAGNSPGFLSQNSTRAYPFSESCSRLDSSGNVVLPNSLVVAGQINATRYHVDGVFYVSVVSVAPDIITLTISYLDASGNSRIIAAVPVVVATHVENKSYVFQGSGIDSSVLGSLAIGDLTETLANVPGTLNFSPATLNFEVNVISISVPAVEAVQVWSGTTLIGTFTNILNLREGSNIRFTYINSTTIRVDAISGENMTAPSACANAPALPPCIRTINGVPGDSSFNLQLEGSSCIDVEPAGSGLSITDLCAQSCCGCSELETLVQSLQNLNTQILSLQNQILTGNETQAAMIANLVANMTN